MKWFSFSIKVVALTAVTLAFGSLVAGETSAQYPPPTGSVSLVTSSATPVTGTTVSVSATVIDQTGAVAPGLSCTFQILSQPGTSAVVDAGPKVTDAHGVATTSLSVGTIPGTITVGANCGTLSSQVAVMATAPQPSSGRLPTTGLGPATDTGSFGWGLVIALLVGGSLAAATGSVLFRTARRGA
jgi:hypothetical protein